jgi:hypothetical protein
MDFGSHKSSLFYERPGACGFPFFQNLKLVRMLVFGRLAVMAAMAALDPHLCVPVFREVPHVYPNRNHDSGSCVSSKGLVTYITSGNRFAFALRSCLLRFNTINLKIFAPPFLQSLYGYA